jgi:pilus assembly protein Flp/PilA
LLYLWSWMQTLGASLRHRDEGATMVEYGMLVAAIALVVVVAAIALGATVFGWFDAGSNAVVPGS